MPDNMWVITEQWRGELTDSSFELLALGRELAEESGAELRAVLTGHGIGNLAGELGVADSVLYLDDPQLEHPTAEATGQALAALVAERQPHVLLFPLTNLTAEVMGALAARLQVPVVNFCRDARIVEGLLEGRSLLYGGKMEAAVTSEHHPTILGVMPGVRRAEAGRCDRAPPVETLAATLTDPLRVKFLRYLEPEPGDVDITQAATLISVGRGIGTEDNLEVAEELANALNGAVCASRPIVDQGWLPLDRQVGKSGAVVSPKLYLALGISGAPEHVEGIKSGELIIAVNTDPEAPIFQVAHYGIVEDAMDVLEALTESLGAGREA